MEFKTKYNMGQEVWLMYNNSPACRLVQQISCNCINPNGTYRVSYGLSSVTGDSRDENLIFATKEDLIKSL